MSFDVSQLRRHVALHGRVARIVVADVQGSAPRETGANMLVWATGQSGTIGGGALEWNAVKRARAIGTPVERIDRIPLGPELGQCCGGAVTLLTEVFDKARADMLPEDAVLRRVEGSLDVPFALQSALMRYRNSGTSLAAQLRQGWMLEPVSEAQIPLWIYGAGHVGRALVSVLDPLPGIAVTWIDTDDSRFPDHIPADTRKLVAVTPAQVAKYAPQDAHHLILTYSHALDLELCHQLLGQQFESVGLIGSKSKWARFRKRLGQLGHGTDNINRIQCPIGNPELGKHPQAIAVGVATALLSQTVRQGTARGKLGNGK